MARVIIFVFLFALVAPHIFARGIGGFDDKTDEEKKEFVSNIFKSAMENGAEVVRNPSSSGNNRIILKLWRQGFTVDDGELRLYDDPKNKEFIDCLNKGVLPPELSQSDNCGKAIEVDMEDHRKEDYVAPKAKPFSGKGHSLNNPSPKKNEKQDFTPQINHQNKDNEK